MSRQLPKLQLQRKSFNLAKAKKSEKKKQLKS